MKRFRVYKRILVIGEEIKEVKYIEQFDDEKQAIDYAKKEHLQNHQRYLVQNHQRYLVYDFGASLSNNGKVIYDTNQ
jgi:hypothetical protein